MPLSLNLPFAACYPATVLARRMRPQKQKAVKVQDQAAYFDRQYRDTRERYNRHMAGFELTGHTVLDIGCGLGGRALGWLDLGARDVINVDINREELEAGRQIVAAKYLEKKDRILYRHPDEMTNEMQGNVAILFDCFEHLMDPSAVLKQVYQWLHPGGTVWIGSIGWYNYLASHCLGTIPIPWCQVIFSERAILKTIRKVLHSPGYVPNMWEEIEGLGRWDHVTTLRDRPGESLNMLSLREVRRILEKSDFHLKRFQRFGFSGRGRTMSRLLSPLSNVPIVDELFHSYYTAVLWKPM